MRVFMLGAIEALYNQTDYFPLILNSSSVVTELFWKTDQEYKIQSFIVLSDKMYLIFQHVGEGFS